MHEFDHISVEALNLPRRIYHALMRGGVLTIGNLRDFCLNRDKYYVPNIGVKSIAEVSKILADLPNNSSLFAIAKREPVQLSFYDGKGSRENLLSAIDILGLPVAIKAVLKKRGIKTVEDLIKTPDPLLLHINLIGPKKLKEIRQLIVEFTNKPEVSAIEEPVVIVEKKTVTWAQIIENYFRNEKDVHSYILISRFGFSPKTLEDIAAELGVSRERVRQVQDAVVFRFLKHVRYSGAIRWDQRVEAIFSEHGDGLSLASLEAILKSDGVLGQFSEPIITEHIRYLDLLETMICWLNLISNKKYTIQQPIEFSVDISVLTKSGKISIKDHTALMNISKIERRKIRRKILYTGGITIKEASKILSKDEKITVLALKNLNLQKIDAEWFTFKSLTDDQDNSKIPLRIAGLKMLAVNPTMNLDLFHDGLRRHASRFYAGIAPIYVIEHILPMLGFEIKGSQISTRLSLKGVLSRSEQCLVFAIKKNGGVASFLEIAEEFFHQNLSLPAVSVTLKRSPITEKTNDGFHKLRDTEIPWQQIEEAKKRQKRFSQNDEVTHGLDGVVRMKFTVNSYAFLTGVIGAYSVKELSGSWSVVNKDISYGEAKMDEVYLWGLAKVFKELDVRMGDRMELGFNTWNRSVSVERLGHGSS